MTITERHSPTSVLAPAVAQGLWRLLVRWADRRKQRLDLDELDDHLLADIGLNREAARREAEKPFWRR